MAMAKKQVLGFPYTPSVERDMKMFYDSLNEKDRRHYAALEAKKLCYGGMTYISDLLDCDRSTVQSGLEELKKNDYPTAEEILIFCDAGGANSYRHNIFKVELQNLANAINRRLKIVHYPPYTSKWNPIEHRVFPHITRAIEGVPLNTVDEAKSKIESAKTKTGLTVVANIIKKNYVSGKKVSKDFMDHLKIRFGDSLPRLNYTILPMDSGVM